MPDDLRSGPDEIGQRDAKQGIELHRMRWVLHISTALAIVALGIVLWVFVV